MGGTCMHTPMDNVRNFSRVPPPFNVSHTTRRQTRLGSTHHMCTTHHMAVGPRVAGLQARIQKRVLVTHCAAESRSANDIRSRYIRGGRVGLVSFRTGPGHSGMTRFIPAGNVETSIGDDISLAMAWDKFSDNFWD
eukprot:4313700-Pyramimonas_sp.AAC.2